ncbi:uncharacterized protein LOC133730712 [Rosa rugosa]|uniref:uncharacterized protein LOC133730712 n=1 Tax=Rosa rugosa TaxID=74645 RepID=UPI002B415652|nr:uncharacterized protein LOC133730712 [Rosa rugosa]
MVDQAIWPVSTSGQFTAKDAYISISTSHPIIPWCKFIWHKAVQPRKSMATWKVLHGRMLTDELLYVIHSFWSWIFQLFRLSFSNQTEDLGLLSPMVLDSFPAPSRKLWCFADSASLYFAPCSSSLGSLPAFQLLSLSPLRLKAPKFIPVRWAPPPVGWLKVNTDGSFRSPEVAGFGGLFRDSDGLFKGAFAYRVIVNSAIDAEILAVIEALRVAWARSWTHIWLETDSTLVRSSLFQFAQSNTLEVQSGMVELEGNSSTDALANYGAQNDGSIWWTSPPRFIAGFYGRDLSYVTHYRYA